MKTKMKLRGFTLIELLVVITIIAILASVSVPVFGSIQRKAKLNKSLQQSRGIYQGIFALYGEDGILPEGESANEILEEVAEEMDSEKPFFVSGCMYHGEGDQQKGPDNQHDKSDPPGETLKAGENHYAVNTRRAIGKSRFPVLASGFTESVGVYTDDDLELGGIWQGKDCVVIWGDGSGEAPKLDDDFKYMEERGGGEPTDMFDQRGRVEMVNPLPAN